MVPLVKTIGSLYCRQSTVWAKLPTLESHMIQYGAFNFNFISSFLLKGGRLSAGGIISQIILEDSLKRDKYENDDLNAVDIDDTKMTFTRSTEEQSTHGDVGDGQWQPNVANLSDFMDNRINRTLKFAALNICGVLSKSKFPEFTDFVNMFDIICLVETKLDQFDTFHVNNFEILTLNKAVRKGLDMGALPY